MFFNPSGEDNGAAPASATNNGIAAAITATAIILDDLFISDTPFFFAHRHARVTAREDQSFRMLFRSSCKDALACRPLMDGDASGDQATPECVGG
jgi:hypothetical protein